MKIKIISETSISFPTYQAGQEYEVHESIAKILVERGYAKYIEEDNESESANDSSEF